MPSTYEKVMFSNTMKLPKETTYLPNTMDIPDHKVETMIAPLRVCIIGGGPAAMFFCHAWNQQKKSASSSPPPQQQLQELDITCFEMKSTPGGVWRSLTSNVNDHVYDELWTNAAAHNFEFHDYTLHEHFDGKPPTIFLPRRDVNEYLVGRVTKNHCAFFRDYFVFDTQVQLVEEAADDDEGSFLVTVRHLPTGQVSTRVFDRCVWAAGENCLGSIPNSLQEVFRGSTVLGRDRKSDLDKEIKGAEPKEAICLLHSAETHLIREHCRDRKVLLIGGELSAEDMALQCLKWGASHVDVAARGDDWCAVSWTSQWPGDKVKVYLERGVDTVKGSQITLKYVQPIWPCGYMPYQENDDVGEVVLEDIQTVIFCTGYSANLDMLHRSLRPESGVIPQFNMGAHPSLFVTDIDWSTWKMSTHNAAHKITGDVAAGKKRIIRANYNHPDMHRGVFFRNPHMMYLCEHGSDTPLLSLDVHAWLLCSYLTRRVPMPPVEEMKKSNNEQFLDQMHLPACRVKFDEVYFEIIRSKAEYWGESNEYFSEDDSDSDDDEGCPCDLEEAEYGKYQLRLLCKVIEEGKYPGISLGNYDSLNINGNQLIKHGDLTYETRAGLKTDHAKDLVWRTFRDADEQARSVISLYTGAKARPLNKRWMDSTEGRYTTIRNGDV